MSKVLLSDLGEFKNGLNYSAADAVLGRKIIGVSNFGDKYVAEYNNLAQIDSTLVTKDYMLEDGDILFVRSNGNKALIGRTMIIQDIKEAMGFSGFCIRFRPDQKLCYPLYILYLLKSPTYRKLFSNTQQTNISNLNQSVLGNIEFELPTLYHQQVIVDTIHLITQKIQLNNKIIAELEAMAKTIYDYWFVQFDFPDANGSPYRTSGGEMVWNEKLKREIPKGWDIGNLYSIANFINGLACQKYRPQNGEQSLPVIKIREMHSGITNDTEEVSAAIPDKYKIDTGHILFSWSATLEVMYWCGGLAGLNQHIFRVNPKSQYPTAYVYHQVSEYVLHFVKMAEARKTTMGHITTDHLTQSIISLPTEKILADFEKIVAPIHEKLLKCNTENKQLTAFRDWLLPMLMNGQARVE